MNKTTTILQLACSIAGTTLQEQFRAVEAKIHDDEAIGAAETKRKRRKQRNRRNFARQECARLWQQHKADLYRSCSPEATPEERALGEKAKQLVLIAVGKE